MYCSHNCQAVVHVRVCVVLHVHLGVLAVLAVLLAVSLHLLLLQGPPGLALPAGLLHDGPHGITPPSTAWQTDHHEPAGDPAAGVHHAAAEATVCRVVATASHPN